jgi:hypothetical protein
VALRHHTLKTFLISPKPIVKPHQPSEFQTFCDLMFLIFVLQNFGLSFLQITRISDSANPPKTWRSQPSSSLYLLRLPTSPHSLVRNYLLFLFCKILRTSFSKLLRTCCDSLLPYIYSTHTAYLPPLFGFLDFVRSFYLCPALFTDF